MKKPLFIGLFAFSLVLNLAVAVTVGRHLWPDRQADQFAAPPAGSPLSDEEYRSIKKMWAHGGRKAMIETRNKIWMKKVEILDTISKNPQDLKAVEPAIIQLLALREKMERDALARVGSMMMQMPPEKRERFVLFLKNRACPIPGKGRGKHRSYMGDGCPPCPERPPVIEAGSQKNSP